MSFGQGMEPQNVECWLRSAEPHKLLTLLAFPISFISRMPLKTGRDNLNKLPLSAVFFKNKK